MNKTVRFTVKYNEDFERTPIEVLDLPQKAINVCGRNKLFTIKDLMDNWSRLDKLRTCGKTTSKVLRNAFIRFYLENATDEKQLRFLDEVSEAV